MAITKYINVLGYDIPIGIISFRIMTLKTIGKRRKMLGLTQAELAREAGVSQSMIAKIEAGLLSPSYDKALAIFNALDSLEQEKSVKARDIMVKKVVTVKSSDKVSRAINLMRQKGLSQLPVFEGGHLVGLVSESIILEHLDTANFGGKEVGKIMGDAPPTVGEDAPLKMLSELLKYAPIVLVYEKAVLKGVVTKSDLLGVVEK